MAIKFSMFNQYGQFYIADSGFKGDTGHPDFWSNDALNDRLAIADGILGVSIENDDAIANGTLRLYDSRIDDLNSYKFDHIVESSLLITTGTLQILDCPNCNAEITIEFAPAWYRVRISSFNLTTAYQERPEDTYLIDVWKEQYSQKNVLKKWQRS